MLSKVNGVDQSVSPADLSNGLILDSPSQMKYASKLADDFTLIILQILNSKFSGRTDNSWWTSNALRQVTYLKQGRNIDQRLSPLVELGLVEKISVDNLPTYNLNKSSFHGLFPQLKSKSKRSNKRTNVTCYRLKFQFVELVFGSQTDRTIFVPVETIRKDNLDYLQLILKTRSMELLQALGKSTEPMNNLGFTQYLNELHGTDQRRYYLEVVVKLATKSFTDNITTKISSDVGEKPEYWRILRRTAGSTIINRIEYLLNYDRLRLYFSNSRGREFDNKSSEIEICTPEKNDVNTTNTDLIESISRDGIVVRVER